MTQFELSDQLKTLIAKSDLLKDERERLLQQPSISHKNIVAFYYRCNPCGSLLELVKTTRLVIPNKTEKNSSFPKSKEFIKQMEILRLQAKEDEYQRLVNPQTLPGLLYEPKNDNDEKFNFAQANKETRSHITTIFNIFISVASVVYAIWYWTSTSWQLRDSYRVLLCLFFGLLILIAEVVVYMSYLGKIEDARKRERSKKEVKKVVRSYDILKGSVQGSIKKHWDHFASILNHLEKFKQLRDAVNLKGCLEST